MRIANTDVDARHPWPEHVRVQGRKGGGPVLVHGVERVFPAFVEAFPGGTFIRGEGATVHDAEDVAWAKYQAVLVCSGNPSGEHGPYDARQYTNGAGFCVACGAWFSGVLPPSQEHQAEAEACAMVKGIYGDAIVGSRWWRGLVQDWTARLLAQARGETWPGPQHPEPTSDELAAWREAKEQPLDPAVLAEVLERLANHTPDDN